MVILVPRVLRSKALVEHSGVVEKFSVMLKKPTWNKNFCISEMNVRTLNTKGSIMAGRKRLPTEIKRIKGTLQPSRTHPSEPKPAGTLAEPPAYMNDGAQAAWRYAIECAPPNLLTRLDMSVLEIWACAADLYRQAQQGLQTTGLLVPAPGSGVPMVSPYLSIANKQAQVMTRAAIEMGFTPSSRSKVTAAPCGPADDLWEGF